MMTSKTKHFSILFAGVGGQGVLSLAQLTMEAARREGYHILQSEIHGMSQRGGMVNSHVQFSTSDIFSPIISQGNADMILATEPLEALRYVSYLKKDGMLFSTKTPMKNFTGYPDLEHVLEKFKTIPSRLVDTDQLLQNLNFKQGLGTLLLGLAAGQLPIKNETWTAVITDLFTPKGSAIIEKNINAFLAGQAL